MNITTHPEDKILREKCVPVKEIDDELLDIIEKMIPKMREADGVGLAAPQIGDNRRFIVVEFEDELFVAINPVIIKKSDETECMEEGCLSLPKTHVDVCRSKEITVEYHDENGDLYEIDLDGFLARIFQHEIDHLDGKLIVDYVDYTKF